MFLVEFDNSGALAYGTYFGGLKNDFGVSIAVDTHGDIYIAGNTDSTNMPLKGSYDKFSGSTDIYIAKFTAVPFSFSSMPHTINFVILAIITGSGMILLVFSVFILVEYRQYKKIKGEKSLHANTEVKNSFKIHLLNKIHKKHAKQVHYTLSEKSLEILEETLKETKSEN